MTDFTEEQINWLQDVQRLRLQPGDVVVVKVPVLEYAVEPRLMEMLRDIFPQNRTLVLPPGFDIGVLGGIEEGEEVVALEGIGGGGGGA